jgi:hypothetical protein
VEEFIEATPHGPGYWPRVQAVAISVLVTVAAAAAAYQVAQWNFETRQERDSDETRQQWRDKVATLVALSLSMVVIAALVGAGGLGKPVVRALNSVNIGMGFEAGLAIVILAIILDRVCKLPERRQMSKT